MDRERQIELMKSAEVRAERYLRAWAKNPQFRAALHRDRRPKSDDRPQPTQRQKKCVGQ
jgi:hypothetical protein